MEEVTPTTTRLFGVAVSILVGTLSGVLAGWASVRLLGLDPRLYYVGFTFGFIVVAGLMFLNGMLNEISVGWKGVITFFGRRLHTFLLSEGGHWLPWAFSYVPVNMKVQTNIPEHMTKEQIEATALKVYSGDESPIAMQTWLFFKFRVTDPYRWLEVENALHTLEEIGEAVLRNEFAGIAAVLLVKPEASSSVSAQLTHELLAEAAELGIEVLEAKVLRILYPEEVEKAIAKFQIELAQRKSEEFEMRTVIQLIQTLKDKGFTAQQAAEIMQIERGKVTAERKIFKIEDADKIAESISKIISDVFRKG